MELSARLLACTQLDDACTCAVLLPQTSEQNETRHVVVVGTMRGRLLVFVHGTSCNTSNYFNCVHSNIESESTDCAITTVVVGDVFNDTEPLVHGDHAVVSAIASNGMLYTYFVHPTTGATTLCFRQRIVSNVCASFVSDIAHDGCKQLFVSLSDRVLRSYRFVTGSSPCLMPQAKWETPEQITALAHSDSPAYGTVLLSQISPHFVRLRWYRAKEGASVDTIAESTGAGPPQSLSMAAIGVPLNEPAIAVETLTAEFKTRYKVDDAWDSCAFLPWNCKSVRFYMNLATRLFLHEPGYPYVQLMLPPGYHVAYVNPLSLALSRLLIVCDMTGHALFFWLSGGFKDHIEKAAIHPIAQTELTQNLVECKATVDIPNAKIYVLAATTDLNLLLYVIDIDRILNMP